MLTLLYCEPAPLISLLDYYELTTFLFELHITTGIYQLKYSIIYKTGGNFFRFVLCIKRIDLEICAVLCPLGGGAKKLKVGFDFSSVCFPILLPPLIAKI